MWDFVVGTRERMPHHDIAPLPNGNVLVLVWERKTREEAIRAGRRPELVADEGLWPDMILEIAPRPPSGGEVVWEWHVWDHLVQDRDPARANFGRVADQPELVHINSPRHVRKVAVSRSDAASTCGAPSRSLAAVHLAPLSDRRRWRRLDRLCRRRGELLGPL